MVHLFELLGGRAFVKIMLLFLRAPEKQRYWSEVRKETKLSRATAGKWLKAAEENGFLSRREEAGRSYYSLNSSNPVAKQLMVLSAVSELYPHLRGFGECYLFGSLARGEGTSESDADLLVISNKNKTEIVAELSKVSKKTKRKISPVIFTPVEFSKLIREDRAFYDRVTRNRIKISD